MPDRPAAGFARLALPAGWRTVDLMSDLHLSEQLPRTTAAWARWLQHTDADAVVLLGDVFEVWIGDDLPPDDFQAGCLEVISRARCPVLWMAGNRDFLLGAQAMARAGLQSLPDPVVVEGPGQEPLLLTHGDELCRGDTSYQAFRRQVRSPAWQQAFLQRPRADRLALAAAIRAESRQRHEERAGMPGMAEGDVDTVAARDWLAAAGCRLMVHGHTHRPGRTAWAQDAAREVLSDWDLDDPGRPRAEVMRWSAAGLARIPVSADVAPPLPSPAPP